MVLSSASLTCSGVWSSRNLVMKERTSSDECLNPLLSMKQKEPVDMKEKKRVAKWLQKVNKQQQNMTKY